MDIEEYLENSLSELGRLYLEMESRIEAPVLINVGGYKKFRHQRISGSLACFLKGVKIVSSLNAALVLLRAGYTQEVGAICRMIDDFCNETFFLLIPQGRDKYRNKQIQFLDDFFQEELDKPMDPLGSTQKRANVPVRKIHATIARIAESELNPSDTQELLRTTHQAFSGYVHGAYPHIMEMYGGNPPTFHLFGMLGTPRIDEWRVQLIGYVYRALMISVLVARKLGLTDAETKVRELLTRFGKETGCKSAKTAADILREIKKKTA
jgi:hypothetical protein